MTANLTQDFDRFLASKGITFWADWTITDPIQRRKAAEWFVKTLAEFKQWEVAEWWANSSPPEGAVQEVFGGAWDVVA